MLFMIFLVVVTLLSTAAPSNKSANVGNLPS